MTAKFHQNAIITGCVSSYCLACDTYLRCEDDTKLHIEKPVHKKNLDSTMYLEKYKRDHIRKVKMGYYCEFCNVLLSTVTNVPIHVVDAKHIATKGTLLLKPLASGVLAYDNILINDKAWHSLTEDTCAICNTEFMNEGIHKNHSSHLLNLVQNKVEFGANNSVYRRIDDTTFQCLTCNTVLAINTKEKHFNDPNHQKNYLKCQIKQNDISDAKNIEEHKHPNKCENKSVAVINQPEKSAVAPKSEILDANITPEQVKANPKNNVADNEKNKSKILDSVAQFQKNEINVNFEIETAFCKKCFVSINFDFDEIETHIEEHKKVEKSSSLSHPSEVNQNHNKTSLGQKREIPKYSQQLDNNIKPLLYKTDVDQNDNEINSQNNAEEIETIVINAACSRVESNAENDVSYLSEPNENKETMKEDKTPDSTFNFAQQNSITYNSTNNNAFCRVCNVKLPSSLRSMKEHVGGMPHKSRVASLASSSKASNKLPKRTSKKFIDNVITIGDFFHEDAVINEKYCLSSLSFLMISENGLRLRCQVCEVSLTKDEVENHSETYSHEKAMTETPVVTCYDSEFVREIRQGLYHCGFCNLIAGSWEDFKNHIKCPEHKLKKSTASVRLRDHMPRIIAHKRQRDLAFLRMMMLGRFGHPLFD